MEYIPLSWTIFSRLCVSYDKFINRGFSLTRNVLNQGHGTGLLKVKVETEMQRGCEKQHPFIYSLTMKTIYGCHNPAHLSSFMPCDQIVLLTGILTWATRRAPLVNQKMYSFPTQLSSSQFSSVVRVAQCLIVWVLCLSFCPFTLGYCICCH